MNIVIFGATGMIGQGVLRECLRDPDVAVVKTIGRSRIGTSHPKLRDIVHPDMRSFASIEAEFFSIDACFFCLGVTSAGLTESEYERVTYDIPVAAATALVRQNPAMTFILVSGAGADSPERGRVMWARVKGKAENAILRLPFNGFVFRPAVVQPMHGIKSRTAIYNVLYAVLWPLLPVIRRLFRSYVLTTEEIGQAMLHVARAGAPKRVLESRDISALIESRKGSTSLSS
ncbi:MAG TPA: hypothetical protein VFP91_07520 [Vicinamibacterales bacterium]|nr:hypothetical protein [Vicinamibacterales bacterium]